MKRYEVFLVAILANLAAAYLWDAWLRQKLLSSPG